MPEDREVNYAAYRRMRKEIDANYPRGRFVAIAGGRIVADSDDGLKLIAQLKKAGFSPPDVLAVQAGVERLEYGVILLPRQAS